MDTVDSGAWRTSSYSGTNGNCVEVRGAAGIVQARDTQDRNGVVLSVPGEAWTSYIASLK